MKKIKLACLALLATVYGCQNSSTPKTNEVKEEKKTIIKYCYLYALNKDTTYLQITDSASVLSGTLDFLPYEKDGTVGTLKDLYYSGDTLWGTYDSWQEGIQTIGEMAFLKKDSTIIISNDYLGVNNYKYDTAYTNGKFIAKNKVVFDGDTLKSINCR